MRDRLVAHVPDVTLLFDRLEESGLIERERSRTDRRLVSTRITPDGLALLRSLDQPVSAMHKQHLGHMTQKQLTAVTALLAIAGSGV